MAVAVAVACIAITDKTPKAMVASGNNDSRMHKNTNTFKHQKVSEQQEGRKFISSWLTKQ